MTQPEIIYEDDDILVCHKPAGVATQTKRLGQKDMESILKNYIAVNNRKAGRMQPPYIGIVHRLDQPVEGVMVYAKTPQAAAKLSAQVKKRFVGKHYYATENKRNKTCLSGLRGCCAEGTKAVAGYYTSYRPTSSDPCAAGTCRNTNCRRYQIREISGESAWIMFLPDFVWTSVQWHRNGLQNYARK